MKCVTAETLLWQSVDYAKKRRLETVAKNKWQGIEYPEHLQWALPRRQYPLGIAPAERFFLIQPDRNKS
jgi:hypothetical protein